MRDHRNPLAVDEDAQNPCLGGQLVETGELGGAGVDQLAVSGQVGMRVLARGGVGLGAAALLGHQFAEAELVDLQAGLGGHLESELDREAVGVVQGEGVRAGDRSGAGCLGGAGDLVEQPRTRHQRAIERGLLGDRDAPDPVEIGDEFGIRRAHRVAHGGHQLADDRALDAQQLGRADHPAQQPAQHVAASVVAGGDAVADQDRRGAAVVGDDPVAHVVFVVAFLIS